MLIFAQLFEKNLVGLKRLGSDFVYGFIHAIDGEKDPRNLFLSFQLARLIVENLDFEPYAQDLFEVIFCYFPITFKSTPNDPLPFTPEELKKSLREVISSTSAFAQYAVPVIIEKLTSDVAAAKLDSMETISACAPIYGAHEFLKHSETLWKTLQKQVYLAIDESTDNCALKCIQELTKSFSLIIGLSAKGKTPLEGLIDMIVTDLMECFMDKDLKHAKQSAKIIVTVSEACVPALYLIMKLYPILLARFRSFEQRSKGFVILDCLVSLIGVCRKYNSNLLIPVLDDTIHTLTSQSDDAGNLQKCIILGICELLRFTNLLSGEQSAMMAAQLITFLLETSQTDFTTFANEFIGKLALDNPKVVSDLIMPRIFEGLYGLDEKVSARSGSILKSVARSTNLVKPIISNIMEIILKDLISFKANTLFKLVAEIASETCKMEQQTSNKQTSMLIYFELVIASIFRHSNSSKFLDLLENTESMAVIISATMERDVEQFQIANIVTAFCVDPIPKTIQLVILLEAVLCGLRPSVDLSKLGDIVVYMLGLIGTAIKLAEYKFCQSVAKICSTLVNKFLSLNQKETFLQQFKTLYVSQIKAGKMNIDTQKGILVIYAWIGKALIMLADSGGFEICQDLFELSNGPSIREAVYESFEILVIDHPKLSKATFAKFKVDYFDVGIT